MFVVGFKVQKKFCERNFLSLHSSFASSPGPIANQLIIAVPMLLNTPEGEIFCWIDVPRSWGSWLPKSSQIVQVTPCANMINFFEGVYFSDSHCGHRKLSHFLGIPTWHKTTTKQKNKTKIKQTTTTSRYGGWWWESEHLYPFKMTS